ncbi:Crp/Fnr family transcriptional regulator [Kushneria phosphatilytica]|uniref:Crp/Fnr family transcriptional regulator n=2 Tax=Kushneria phosphatilytica TaxID=657387 RepID=A0A1S1NRD7_9GAMM|nr:Crp/Fnr family transcriptional regulator [Kushneria phosphatilytica]QEL12687.1 Crp/Fnr family transcriptional regulator [Kushneria phosphatilytica]
MVSQLQHYARFNEREVELLNTLERSPEDIAAGEDLWREGDSAGDMAVISKGWACSYYSMEDGTRLILDILLPGDIAGLREFAQSEHQAGVRTVTDCTVCRFPYRHLTEVFDQSSKLTRVIFAAAATQQSILVERMINLGRRDAATRIAHLLCEMYTRLQRMNSNMTSQFRLPLSQEILADVTGLSAVHVSRTFTHLNTEGLARRYRHQVDIPDLARLKEFAGFSEGYLGASSVIDTRQ